MFFLSSKNFAFKMLFFKFYYLNTKCRYIYPDITFNFVCPYIYTIYLSWALVKCHKKWDPIGLAVESVFWTDRQTPRQTNHVYRFCMVSNTILFIHCTLNSEQSFLQNIFLLFQVVFTMYTKRSVLQIFCVFKNDLQCTLYITIYSAQ